MIGMRFVCLYAIVPVCACLPPQVSILGHVMHTLSGLATLPEARARYIAVPRFADFLCLALSVTQAPKVMQHSLQVRPFVPLTLLGGSDCGLMRPCLFLWVCERR